MNTNSLINEVLYDAYLFEDTIYNNIRFARPDASMEEVVAATELAGVIDFAWNLPEGLHTRIGHTGTELSHTQKLRISLARVLLRQSGCCPAHRPVIAATMEELRSRLTNQTMVVVLGQDMLLLQNNCELAVLADQ